MGCGTGGGHGAEVTPRVHVEWARRVAAEYGSAAIAAQTLTWAIQVGLSPELLHVAVRVVRDELDHAALAFQTLVALGGGDTPVDVAAADFGSPGGAPVFPAVVDTVVQSFCLGETLAVPLFAAMRRRATHPATRPVLDRILEDEAVHRALGWDLLDALITVDPGVVAYVARRLPALMDRWSAYRDPPAAPALTDAERACGLLDHAEYGEIYARTWAEDVVPRFARRGIRIVPDMPAP